MKTELEPDPTPQCGVGNPERVICVNDSNFHPGNSFPNGPVRKGLVYHVTKSVRIGADPGYLILGFPALSTEVPGDVGWKAYRFKTLR